MSGPKRGDPDAGNACDDQGLAGASLDSTLATAVRLLDARAHLVR